MKSKHNKQKHNIEAAVFNKLLFLFFVPIFFFGCEDTSDQSPIVLLIDPLEPVLVEEMDKMIVFDIDLSSNAMLASFEVMQEDAVNGQVQLMDTTLSEKEFDYSFQYRIPFYDDTTQVFLEFVATNEHGIESIISQEITALPNDQQLVESSGHVMFSALSGKTDGFNIWQDQAVICHQNYSPNIHFKDNSVDSIHGHTLSREWISPAGLKFVRFQGFSFPTATYTMIQDSYAYGQKTQELKDIVNDDIVLIGNDTQAYAVVYVVQVLDSDSTQNDKYVLNMKRIVQ